jgi:CheY-like chemotaxis protein
MGEVTQLAEAPVDRETEAPARRVLIVEDSRSDALLLREALAEEGWDRSGTEVVGTLRDAREALSMAPFDAILLDLTLPDATGLESVSVLAAAAPSVPIVVVTGQPGGSIVVAALVEGADEFVSKHDLRSDVVAGAVVRAIGRRVGQVRVQAPARAFDSIDAPCVVVDGSGRIVATNRAWDFAAHVGGAAADQVGVGVSYLHVCDVAVGDFAEGAARAAAGIRSVLSGGTETFTLDYPCPADGVDRWYSMRVSALGAVGGGGVITHLDISALKEAENVVRTAPTELASLVDESYPIFARLDASGTVLDVSARTQELLGLRPFDVVGSSAFDRIDPQDLPRA